MIENTVWNLISWLYQKLTGPDPVIFLPMLPASFAHYFVMIMQSFHFSQSQDTMVLQTCHEK